MMRKLESTFMLLLFLLTSGLHSQGEFIDLYGRGMSPRSIGSEILYGSMNDRLPDTTFKSVEFTPKKLQEFNHYFFVKELNEYENIVSFKISNRSFFKKETVAFEIPLFRNLQHIRYFELYGSKLNCDYEALFEEISLIPNLEYLTMPDYNSTGIDTLQSFQKLFPSIKGLKIKDNEFHFPVVPSALEELTLHQPHDILLSNLEMIDKSNLTALNIWSDTINDDIVKIIGNFHNIKHLYINAKSYVTSVSTIEELEKLNALENLKMNKISAEDFKNLGKLTHINKLEITLDSLQTEDISPVFNMKKLDNLVLNVRNSKSLSWSNTQYNTLIKMEIKGSVEQISTNIGSLINLEELKAGYNELTSLPSSIGELSKLKLLDIVYNKITILPESISNLKSLEYFNANNNLLTFLPENIGKLINLKELKLARNDIKSLPTSIGSLSNLVQLDISRNFINSIPSSLYNLRNLESLNLSSNALIGLPDGISKMKNLKGISLSKYNSILRIEEEGRKERSTNNIKFIPNDLWKLENIEEIDFSDNSEIDESIVGQLLRMKKPGCIVKLKNCGIEKLPESGWKESNLKSIDISKNLITNVPEQLYYSNIPNIDMRSNELGLMDTYIKNTTNLRLYGFLAGEVSKEELLEREDVFDVIMDVAGRGYYYGRENPILDIYPLAYEIDSVRTTSMIDHDNYAEALFEAGEYEKSIPHFDIAIEQDLMSRVRFVNSLYPKIHNRHIAYLEIRDTISAISDLELIGDELGYNMSSDIALLYLESGDKDNYNININAAVSYFEEKKTKDIGEELSLLELYIISSNKEKFYELSDLIANGDKLTDYYKVIYDYLIEVHAVTIDTEANLNSYIADFSETNFENENWSCELIQKWALSLDTLQKEKIIALNQLICPLKSE